MQHEKQDRCINLDWLEVYVLESNDRYPCNAEYFRRKGYLVQERAYGSKVWGEIFTIVNEKNEPLIEIRRNPNSGNSSFTGLAPESCHIRLPNWMLYFGNPVAYLTEFLLLHEYIFKRIYRLDIALDFVRFDSGDKPAKFVRRFLQGQYRKINQCSIAAHGSDDWNSTNWNSVSWGSRSSMVSTKLYNKTMELEQAGNDKPYIRSAWMNHGIVDNPLSLVKYDRHGKPEKVDVWRLEYSIKSECNGWCVIEVENGKKMVKQHIPHRLSLYDSPDKLWQRFQDLTYHYFRFKYREYADEKSSVSGYALSLVHSDVERPLKRKDRCRDKKLFYFDGGHRFQKIDRAPSAQLARKEDDVLERRLRMYRETHFNLDIRHACDVILKEIELNRLVNYSPDHNFVEARALQLTLMRKMGGDQRAVTQLLEEIMQLIKQDGIY